MKSHISVFHPLMASYRWEMDTWRPILKRARISRLCPADVFFPPKIRDPSSLLGDFHREIEVLKPMGVGAPNFRTNRHTYIILYVCIKNTFHVLFMNVCISMGCLWWVTVFAGFSSPSEVGSWTCRALCWLCLGCPADMPCFCFFLLWVQSRRKYSNIKVCVYIYLYVGISRCVYIYITVLHVYIYSIYIYMYTQSTFLRTYYISIYILWAAHGLLIHPTAGAWLRVFLSLWF